MSLSGPSVGPGKIMGGGDGVGVVVFVGEAVGAPVAPVEHAASVTATRSIHPEARRVSMPAETTIDFVRFRRTDGFSSSDQLPRVPGLD